MIRKSLKYILLIFINAMILTGLLFLWTDKYELVFNSSIRQWQLIQLLGLGFIALLGIKLLIYFFDKKKVFNKQKRIRYASILILVLYSYHYVFYSYKIIDVRLINSSIRKEIKQKIIKSEHETNVVVCKDLKYHEYKYIEKNNGYPVLPLKADSISIDYWYEGFLPDYHFNLTYYVPKGVDIDTFSINKPLFSSGRRYEEKNGKLFVSYFELRR